jgi:hypothetical protein
LTQVNLVATEENLYPLDMVNWRPETVIESDVKSTDALLNPENQKIVDSLSVDMTSVKTKRKV